MVHSIDSYDDVGRDLAKRTMYLVVYSKHRDGLPITEPFYDLESAKNFAKRTENVVGIKRSEPVLTFKVTWVTEEELSAPAPPRRKGRLVAK